MSCRLSSFLPLEADIDKALGATPEVEEEADDKAKSDDDDSGDESSDDGIGFLKKAKREKPEERPKKPATRRKMEKPDPQDPEKEKAAATKQSRAEQCLVTLRTFDPLAFFNGSQKEKDWQSKIDKANSLTSSMDSSEDGQELSKALQTHAQDILTVMELLKNIRDASPSGALDDFPTMPQGDVQQLAALRADCLTAVLQGCGKKFLEAPSQCLLIFFTQFKFTPMFFHSNLPNSQLTMFGHLISSWKFPPSPFGRIPQTMPATAPCSSSSCL